MTLFGRVYGIVLLGLWIISLPLPAVQLGSAKGYWEHGYEILGQGWMGVLTEGQVGWLGNPLLAYAIYRLFRAQVVSLIIGIILLAIFIVAWRWTSIEAEGRDIIFAYGAGYFCWIAAVALGALASPLTLLIRLCKLAQ